MRPIAHNVMPKRRSALAALLTLAASLTLVPHLAAQQRPAPQQRGAAHGEGYTKAEIWYGGRRVDGPQRRPAAEPAATENPPAPRQQVDVAAVARHMLGDARLLAERGEIDAARSLARRAESLGVTWAADEPSPAAFLAWLENRAPVPRLLLHQSPRQAEARSNETSAPRRHPVPAEEADAARNVEPQPKDDAAAGTRLEPLPSYNLRTSEFESSFDGSFDGGPATVHTAEAAIDRGWNERQIERASADLTSRASTPSAERSVSPLSPAPIAAIPTLSLPDPDGPGAGFVWLTFFVGLLLGIVLVGLAALVAIKRLCGRLEPLIRAPIWNPAAWSFLAPRPEPVPVPVNMPAQRGSEERGSAEREPSQSWHEPGSTPLRSTRGVIDPELPLAALTSSYERQRAGKQSKQQEMETAILASVMSQNLGLRDALSRRGSS